MTNGGSHLGPGECGRVEVRIPVARLRVGRVVRTTTDHDRQIRAPGEDDLRALGGDRSAHAVRGDRGAVTEPVGELGAEGKAVVHAVRRRRFVVRAVERDGAGVVTATALGELHDDHVVRLTCEDAALEGHARADVAGCDQALGEIELAAVAVDRAEIVLRDIDRHMRQLGEAAEIGPPVGELPVLIEYVIDPAGPHGGVGDEEQFVRGVVADESAELTVADRQRPLQHRVLVSRCAVPHPRRRTLALGEHRGCGGALRRGGGGEGGEAAESGERSDGGGEREHATAAGAGLRRGVRMLVVHGTTPFLRTCWRARYGVEGSGRECGQGQHGTGARRSRRAPGCGRATGLPERNVDLVDVG